MIAPVNACRTFKQEHGDRAMFLGCPSRADRCTRYDHPLEVAADDAECAGALCSYARPDDGVTSNLPGAIPRGQTPSLPNRPHLPSPNNTIEFGAGVRAGHRTDRDHLPAGASKCRRPLFA